MEAMRPAREVTEARIATMRALLSRADGATAAELIEVTGTTKQNVFQWIHKLGAVRKRGRWYLNGKAGT